MFCEGCGSLIMSIPKNGKMVCDGPKCKDIQTKLKDEFAQVVVIKALDERDYSVIEKLRRPTTDAYECPQCGECEAMTELRQMDQTDEPEVLFLDCVACGFGWREA